MAAKKKQKAIEQTAMITPMQYSKLRGYSNHNYVNRLIKNGEKDKLPNIITWHKFGRFTTLTVKAHANGLPNVPELTEDEKTANNNRAKAKLATI